MLHVVELPEPSAALAGILFDHGVFGMDRQTRRIECSEGESARNQHDGEIHAVAGDQTVASDIGRGPGLCDGCANGVGVPDKGGEDHKRRLAAIARNAGPIGIVCAAKTGLDTIQSVGPAVVYPCVASFEGHALSKLEISRRRRVGHRHTKTGDQDRQRLSFHWFLTLGSAHMP